MTVGRHLGRYELLEQLGEGGMGTVWLARLSGAAGFEKLCIVKTVLPSIAKDAEFVSRFLHEGRVLTQLAHGNIAQVLDMNEADGQLFLALEYVAGVDLSRLHEQVRAAQEYMPLQLVVALIVQAAEGLGAAHRKAALDGSPLNIVHRDISPHNIMVSYEGEVKVIDFGIAKSEARSRHTAQASVMGKLGYMAPEQARGEPLDHRADQFALAIVGWELLSNLTWVKRGTLTEMVVAMAHPPAARPLTPLRPDVPPSLEAVVLKALSPLPADRFATTDEFAQTLMGELLKLGTPPTKPQLGDYVRLRCASDFTTQHQLLTRVSTQRSPPPDPDRPRSEMFAETVVRTPGSPSAATAEHRGPSASTQVPTAESTLANSSPSSLASPTGQSPASLDSARDERRGSFPPPVPTATDRPAVEPNATSPGRPAVLPAPSMPGSTPIDRPSVRLDVAAVPARAEPPLTAHELAVAAPRRSPVGLVVGIIALIGLIAALLYALRPAPQQPVVLTPPPAPVVDAGAPAPALVVVPDAPEIDAGSAAPDPAPAVEVPTLKVRGRFSAKAWIIANSDRSTWTQCRMTLPGQKVMVVGTLARGSSVELPLRRFAFDPNATPILNQARVDCAQGFGLIDLP